MKDDTSKAPIDALFAAVSALGDIAHALNARRLLAEDPNRGNETIRAALAAEALSDEQLDAIAVAAAEAGTLVLAAAGHPEVVVRTCDGGLGSEEYERYAASLPS